MRESDREFYDQVRKRSKEWKLIKQFIIPKEKGRAFVVKRGQIFRVVCVEGPQCADVLIFNQHNPTETFHQGQTRILEGVHPSVYAYMWSNLTPPRPMLTVIEDTAPPFSHDLLWGGGVGSGCNTQSWAWFTGDKNHPNCNDAFIEAIKAFGLSANDRHNNLNLFWNTGIDMNSPSHKLTYGRTEAKLGDYISFFAEMDCIVAIVACAVGGGEFIDGLWWEGKSSKKPQARPLKIEIFNPEFVRLTTSFYQIV